MKAIPGSAEKEDRQKKTQAVGSAENPQMSFDSGGSSLPVSSKAEEHSRTSPKSQQPVISAEDQKKLPQKEKKAAVKAVGVRQQKEQTLPVSKQKARIVPAENKATVVKLGGVDLSKLEKILKTAEDRTYSDPNRKQKKKILKLTAQVHATQDDGDEKATTPTKPLAKQSPSIASDRNSGNDHYYPEGCDE